MSEPPTHSILRGNIGLIVCTILSYAFAWFFGNEVSTINPDGVVQKSAEGIVTRVSAFAHGFNAITITLVFVGISFTVAGMLLATSFAHYPFSVKARAFAKSSAIYTGLMAIGMILGQLAQRGFL